MSKETVETTAWWESYRTDLANRDTHRLEVFFRSLAPKQGTHDKRKQVFERLEAGTEAGVVDGYRVHVVGEGMCLCENCTETRLARHLYETLEQLQAGGDEPVEPVGFRERAVDSTITEEEYELLVPPEVSLAVYVDEELRGVFPASIEGTSVAVSDFLDALATLEPERVPSQAGV